MNQTRQMHCGVFIAGAPLRPRQYESPMSLYEENRRVVSIEGVGRGSVAMMLPYGWLTSGLSEYSGEHFADLTADSVVRTGGVLNDIFSQFALFVQWHLYFFPALQFGLVPAAGVTDAVQTFFKRGLDEDQGITVFMEAGLHEEWGVPDIRQNRRIVR